MNRKRLPAEAGLPAATIDDSRCGRSDRAPRTFRTNPSGSCGALRKADADQAPAQPLPQDDVYDVYRIDLLGRRERDGRWIPSGVDHFIFGTEAPPLKPLKKAGVDIIKSLKLSPADEAKVFSQKARRLLKI